MRRNVGPLVFVALVVSAVLFPRAAAPSGAIVCQPAGLSPLLAPGRILLLGEIHGGVEGPALLGEAACAASLHAGVAVVALEVPTEEQARLTAFLDSDGTTEDRRALLAGPFWQRSYQDGRSSVALLELLAQLRFLRKAGHDVRVVAFDEGPVGAGQVRDDAMAAALIAAVDAAPAGAVTLVFAGNVHTRSRVGVPWDAAYRPAGVAVRDRWPQRVVSLLLRAPAGETWMCTSGEEASCGRHPLGGVSGDAGHVELFAAPRDGYDGAVQLAAATASPPAKSAAP
jgi:hypothetical protein